ncbi:MULTISPECIES: HAD-IIB family hydrolase [unclassified Halomonas]|uniref:HAD-IIB family hydrolase n=1 Tax=unclassified Halomonas TaxID=2609666 RepID=UPI0006DA79C2|nr:MULTISPECIES: HAD-IIB family hydrolase [unclassified Halomonas]KPQ19127.1 MAG: mannosyl-3-phosphoglycerate phosphatase MpgP [Halomonas sp. HL-93]SBR47503.1 mannosyl-3-phosphoglycerate phosphatase [Halomonas sp. HL-93]SNY99244.1 mannosyl-3-phosphoglycerate phosphatase [Halomonas sp. hl-4]
MLEHASASAPPDNRAHDIGPPRLVVTDLDGSLLDHHSYDATPAKAWLAQLKQAKVPVIPVTSKTRAELLPLREALGLTATPFIAENGAVIGLPPGWCHARLDRPGNGRDGMVIKQPSVDIGFIRARLRVWRKRLGVRFTPMSELTLDDLIGLTGLDATQAKLARQREGSEPLLWHDDDTALETFRCALEGDGLQLTQGGRFCHVMGSASDKGSAVTWLIGRFRALRGRDPLSLGLGDGPNDVSMLNAVDQAVVIRGRHDLVVEPSNPHLYRTQATGPEGWVEGVSHWWGDALSPANPRDAKEANA